MEIVTLAFNRPDFIELQLNSIKKYVKDFTYTVFDNCPDDAVENECKRLGVKCVPIKIFSADPSWCVGISLNKMWNILKYSTGTLVYLDSDMFLIGELPSMENHDFAFVPQKKGDIYYPWTGLMMFNMETLPYPHELKWNVDYNVKDADVGGLNHYYLRENNPKVLELEMRTLIDDGRYSFNGKDMLAGDYGELEKLAHKYNFPRPYSFDMLRVKNKPHFIFHYKSASNYPIFYTPEYNRLKTIALKKCLS